MNRLLAVALFFLSFYSISQFGTINNPGFENWLQSGSYEQLNTWVTNEGQDSNLVDKSSDAQDQNVSIKLNTVNLNGVPTSGFLALGEFGAGLSGYPYTAIVDSMICYLKYNFNAGDSGTVIVAQFVQGTPIPNLFKIGGIQNTWTRNAFNLISPFQDSILILFSAGDLFGAPGTVGNTVYVDNVKLKGFFPVPAVPNPSFEIWDMIQIESPTDYQTSNDFLVQSGLNPNVTKTTDAHSGNFAAKLETTGIGVGSIPGVITNASFTGITGQPFSGTPVALEGFYKFNSLSGDTAQIGVEFWEAGNSIGTYILDIFANTSSYTFFSIWIQNLAGTADTMTFTAASGSEDGILFLDDLEFTGGNLSQKEIESFKVEVYPNPVGDYLILKSNETIEIIEVYSLEGTLVQKIENQGDLKLVEMKAHAPGVYLFHFKTSTSNLIKRVVVN